MADLDTTLNLGVGGNVVIGINVGGKVLPVSALRLADGSDIGTSNPLPVGWATAQPVSLTSTTITGTVAATQSGSWSVGVSSLPALAAGTNVIGHVVVDSAASVAVTSLPAITFAAPQHVVVDSATLGTVTVTGSVTTSGTATVSGTVAVSSLPNVTIGAALPAGSAVIGHVITDTGSTTAVTGNVAVTAAALPLPSGAATSALQGGGLPAGLGAHGGLVIEGVASGVAVPTSLASLPSLAAGSNAIGSVTVTSAPTTAVTNAGLSNIDVALSTRALESGGNLATIATNTGHIPTQGQALAASSMPVVLTAIQVAQLAQDASVLARCLLGQQASASSRSVIHPSDASIRFVDCTPTGKLWTTEIGVLLATGAGAAGTLVVPAVAGQYLRSLTLENPINGGTIFYFVYHGAAPAWPTTSGPTIADNTLIAAASIAANNRLNVYQDLAGGLLVPNGVTVVVSTTSGATSTSYAAPTSRLYAVARYGT